MVTVETEGTGWILEPVSRGLGSHVGYVGERDAEENLRGCAWSNCVALLTAMEKSGGKLRMGRKINKSTLNISRCLSESKMDMSDMYLICESRLRN